ncbi:YjcZ family sporulation protein [Caldalkalibacillus thermarum]|nr:YjcZ family sporulation protein [Caldalkalibacillus thermarum]
MSAPISPFASPFTLIVVLFILLIIVGCFCFVPVTKPYC